LWRFDITLQVIGAGAGRKYRIAFDVQKRTPFTPEEITTIKSDHLLLSEIYEQMRTASQPA
jgi:hypothetical protein